MPLARKNGSKWSFDNWMMTSLQNIPTHWECLKCRQVFVFTLKKVRLPLWCHEKNTVWDLESRRLCDVLLCELGKEHHFSWFAEKIGAIVEEKFHLCPLRIRQSPCIYSPKAVSLLLLWWVNSVHFSRVPGPSPTRTKISLITVISFLSCIIKFPLFSLSLPSWCKDPVIFSISPRSP